MPSNLSDTLEPYPMHKHLDLKSVKELPESHAWVPLDGFPSGDPCYSVESVPVIDLCDPNAVKHMGHACKTWGVFQVTNHDIPKSLIDDMEGAARRLFSLPIDQKIKANRSPDGVSGYGVARISSFFSKLMWSEGFTIFGSPLEHARQLWPQDYTTFCKVIEEYEKAMKKLAEKLMWLMLASLDIAKKDIKWVGADGDLKGASAALQLNFYPACPDPDRAMGLAAHTDSTLLTILHQSNTSGLQVFREETGWVTVPPLPGALVINLGDLLHMLSNGLYPSVLHRAMVNRTENRFSIAYLYGPPSSVEISPHSKLVDHLHPPLYRSVTWSDYLRIKTKHFNKSLSLLRLSHHLHLFLNTNHINSEY